MSDISLQVRKVLREEYPFIFDKNFKSFVQYLSKNFAYLPTKDRRKVITHERDRALLPIELQLDEIPVGTSYKATVYVSDECKTVHLYTDSASYDITAIRLVTPQTKEGE